MFLPLLFEPAWAETLKGGISMMHNRQKVKLLLWFATLFSVLALVVVPALAIEPFTLTVEKAGVGTGTVTSNDGKINCGEVCEATYEPPPAGKLMLPRLEVTLTATPDAGFVFTHWGQNCNCRPLGSTHSGAGLGPGTCTIIGAYGETRTCTANFGLPVGGIAVPVNKLGLVAPWLGLAALASLAVLTVALVRRRRSA
jgi:hypothetical protein